MGTTQQSTCPACGKTQCPYWCALNDDPYASGTGVRKAGQ